MIRLNPNDPCLERLQMSDLVAYLEAHFWQPLPCPNERILLFAGPLDDDGRPIELMLPRESEFRDSPLRLAEAINLLAAVEDRLPQRIIQEIKFGKEWTAETATERQRAWRGFFFRLTEVIGLVVCGYLLFAGVDGRWVTPLIVILLLVFGYSFRPARNSEWKVAQLDPRVKAEIAEQVLELIEQKRRTGNEPSSTH